MKDIFDLVVIVVFVAWIAFSNFQLLRKLDKEMTKSNMFHERIVKLEAQLKFYKEPKR